MKAVMLHAYGDASVLKVVSCPVMKPDPYSVLVKVHACGLNHLDIWVRKGAVGSKVPLPKVLGSDAVGVIEEKGDQVTSYAVGDKVIILPGYGCGQCRACSGGDEDLCSNYHIRGESTSGVHATYVCVPAWQVVPMPSILNYSEAAALGVASLTAWHMLARRAQLREGESVLVQGAGSGVGTAAIQIAKAMGAYVFAATTSADKCDTLRSLGADCVIHTQSEDLVQRIQKETDHHGVHVVFEHVGPATWKQSLQCMAWHGRLVTCGGTTGAKVDLDLQYLFFKRQSILGSTMGSKADFLDMLRLVEQKRLRAVVHAVVPFNDVVQAHQMLEERTVCGKVVLQA